MRITRCLVGFLLASLTCAVVHVLFVLPPSDYVGNPDYLAAIGVWVPLAFLHSAVFAAPFALVGLMWAERRRIRHWSYFIGIGAVIAAIGFAAQLAQLGTGQPSMVLGYSLAAFLAGGVSGGLMYWAIAGRKTGRA